jgi:hypothetical protein
MTFLFDRLQGGWLLGYWVNKLHSRMGMKLRIWITLGEGKFRLGLVLSPFSIVLHLEKNYFDCFILRYKRPSKTK